MTSFDQYECFAMVREEEAERHRPYDFVVKLRPDEQLCRPFPSWQHFLATDRIAVFGKPARFGPEIHDHVAVMRRSHADRYFSAHNEIDDCAAPSTYDSICHVKAGQRPNNDTPTECMLSRWLLKGGAAYDNGDVLGSGIVCLWRYSNATGLRCNMGTKKLLHPVSSPCELPSFTTGTTFSRRNSSVATAAVAAARATPASREKQRYNTLNHANHAYLGTVRSSVVLALVVPLHEPKFRSGLDFLKSVRDYPHRPLWFSPVFESLGQQGSFMAMLNGTAFSTVLPWLFPIVVTVDPRNPAASKKLMGLVHIFSMRDDVTHAIALDAESKVQTTEHYGSFVRAWAIQQKVVLWRPTAFSLETCHGGLYFQHTLDSCAGVGLPIIPGFPWWADAPIFERIDFFDFVHRVRWSTLGRPPFLEHAAYMCYKHHVHGWSFLNSVLWLENAKCRDQNQLNNYTFVWSRDKCESRFLQFHLDRKMPRSGSLRFGPLSCQSYFNDQI